LQSSATKYPYQGNQRYRNLVRVEISNIASPSFYSTPLDLPSYVLRPQQRVDEGYADPFRYPQPLASSSVGGNYGFQGRAQSRNFNHMKTLSVPRYSGPAESKTPYDFIVELKKYQILTGTSDEVMLQGVIPLALEGQGFYWFRFERNQPFLSWEDFTSRFRREFQVLGYE